MKFTPNCIVSYKGVFHPGGVPFDIDPADRDMMSRLGAVEEEPRKPPRKRAPKED